MRTKELALKKHFSNEKHFVNFLKQKVSTDQALKMLVVIFFGRGIDFGGAFF